MNAWAQIIAEFCNEHNRLSQGLKHGEILQMADDALHQATEALFKEQLALKLAKQNNLAEQTAQLTLNIALLEADVKRIKQQADTIRASAAIGRAQAAIAKRQAQGIKTALNALAKRQRNNN